LKEDLAGVNHFFGEIFLEDFSPPAVQLPTAIVLSHRFWNTR